MKSKFLSLSALAIMLSFSLSPLAETKHENKKPHHKKVKEECKEEKVKEECDKAEQKK